MSCAYVSTQFVMSCCVVCEPAKSRSSHQDRQQSVEEEAEEAAEESVEEAGAQVSKQPSTACCHFPLDSVQAHGNIKLIKPIKNINTWI
jgi:hypothetical protein